VRRAVTTLGVYARAQRVRAMQMKRSRHWELMRKRDRAMNVTHRSAQASRTRCFVYMPGLRSDLQLHCLATAKGL